MYGERGVGKTSLVNILSIVYRSPLRDTIYVRVNAAPNDSFSSLWRNVFKRLSYKADDGTTKRIADSYPEGLTPDDVQMELESVSNKSAVIVLD